MLLGVRCALPVEAEAGGQGAANFGDGGPERGGKRQRLKGCESVVLGWQLDRELGHLGEQMTAGGISAARQGGAEVVVVDEKRTLWSQLLVLSPT